MVHSPQQGILFWHPPPRGYRYDTEFGICYERFGPADALIGHGSHSGIGHAFHARCLMRWIFMSPRLPDCPLCSRRVPPNLDDLPLTFFYKSMAIGALEGSVFGGLLFAGGLKSLALDPLSDSLALRAIVGLSACLGNQVCRGIVSEPLELSMQALIGVACVGGFYGSMHGMVLGAGTQLSGRFDQLVFTNSKQLESRMKNSLEKVVQIQILVFAFLFGISDAAIGINAPALFIPLGLGIALGNQRLRYVMRILRWSLFLQILINRLWWLFELPFATDYCDVEAILGTNSSNLSVQSQ